MSYSELDLNILKVLITNKKYALEFSSSLDVKLFNSDIWNFAQTIINYIKTYKELPTKRIILEKLSKNEKLKENIISIWQKIDDIIYDEKEYKYDLEKLKNRYAEEQISLLKDSLSKFEEIKNVNKSISDMQKTIQNIKSLNQNKSFERKTLKEAIPAFREEYNAKLKDPKFDEGIKTGYSYLDEATGGLRGGELLLIGGESSSGKSMLLLNMAIQIWMQGNNIYSEEFEPGNDILYFSLEMPFKPCLNRTLARLAEIPAKKIRKSMLDNDEGIKLKKALKFISKFPNQFQIIDIPRGSTINDIEQHYEDAKNYFNPKIVAIDYLSLMDYEKKDMEDWLKLGYVSESMHEFSRKNNCTVLSAVQLNRVNPSKSVEEKIGMHRIGRSALIMQNANIGIQIESRVSESNYPQLNYHLIKNRDGELGQGSLVKNFACGSLLDDKYEPGDLDSFCENVNDISGKMNSLDIEL